MNPPAFSFPVETINVPMGGDSWAITCLRSRDIFAATNRVSQRDLYAFVLWESPLGYANICWHITSLYSRNECLELGAGVGLPGMVAQRLGGQIAQTDYQLDSLTLCQWNAKQNNIATEIFQADWRQWPHTSRYDLIIAADILYDEVFHYYIERIFYRNLAVGGQILLADPGRQQALDFVVHLEEHGWHVGIDTQYIIPQLNGDANPLTPSRYGAVEVTIFTLTRGNAK